MLLTAELVDSAFGPDGLAEEKSGGGLSAVVRTVDSKVGLIGKGQHMADEAEIIDHIKQRFEDGWTAGFECDEGWLPLITDLHVRLTALVPDYGLLQVKEKFGGLRYYTSLDGVDEKTATAFYSLVHEAEERSCTICERCGQSGKLSKKGGWYKTVCSTCARRFGFKSPSDAGSGD